MPRKGSKDCHYGSTGASAQSSTSITPFYYPGHHNHSRHHHLPLITRFSSLLVNALLISIIAFQLFGVGATSGTTTFASVDDEDDAARNTAEPTSMSSSSSPAYINNDMSHYPDHTSQENDNGAFNKDNTGIFSDNRDAQEAERQPSVALAVPSPPPQPQRKRNDYQYEKAPARAPAECTQEPRFSILTSDSLLRTANVSYDSNKAEIWTFGRIYLVLECRASSPIDLRFDGHLINKFQSVETSRITYDDPRMPSCYSIAITIETKRESTGNYTCWSLREPILSTSIYLFAHGGTPPYLLHADIGIDVIDVDTDLYSREVTIPCVVTNPNISVALYKIQFEGFTLLPLGDYLSYDPKRGFILQFRNYPEPFGKYKCLAMNSSYYDVIVNVKPPTDNFFHEPIVQGRLEIIQDRFQSHLFICNSSSQAPNIVTTSDCLTPIECRLAAQCLKKNPHCSSQCRCSVRGDKCSRTLESNYAQIGFPIDTGCSTLSANINGGVVHCSAPNFEPSAEVMYFIGLNGRIVQNWKSVPKGELVELGTLYEMPRNVVFFVGEKIEFGCRAAKFLFSRGFQWKFKLGNGTFINANPKPLDTQVFEGEGYITEIVIVQITRADIASLFCYAPLWNETEWVQNRLDLPIKDSVAPSFLDPENSTVDFYVNDLNKSITCEAEGFPPPGIMWIKNGEEYINDLETRIFGNYTNATVFLPEVTLLDDQAVFVCNATNHRGTILKTITINVREASLKLTLTLIGVAFILLIGVFAIILWIFYTSARRIKPGKLYVFTDHDIDEFYNGNPNAAKKCGDNAVTKAFYLPYDTRIELNADDLLIDYQSPLGEGQFGVVLQGKLQTEQGTLPVAVKTTKDSDPSQLRSLLSEIKLMIFIGRHENIIGLIGAITKDLHKREVYVVVEYCQFGNIEDHLRKHRGTFHDEFGVNGTLSQCSSAAVRYVRLDSMMKTSDLINWSYQITNGMEYLASKKIIHGDVALRNMLLDANQNVKITDFGLSKHIYTPTTHYQTKKSMQDNPLPWRWMAPETLKDQIFSMSGDVWSFGVLLYEMFSLGELPYAEFTYNEEFLTLLANGYRLKEPPYVNTEIYATMRNCWRLDPTERPSFTVLKQFFSRFMQMQHPPNQSELVQQLQLRQFFNRPQSTNGLDTDSSDVDNITLTTLAPTANSFSTFGSVTSVLSGHQQHPQRPGPSSGMNGMIPKR